MPLEGLFSQYAPAWFQDRQPKGGGEAGSSVAPLISNLKGRTTVYPVPEIWSPSVSPPTMGGLSVVPLFKQILPWDPMGPAWGSSGYFSVSAELTSFCVPGMALLRGLSIPVFPFCSGFSLSLWLWSFLRAWCHPQACRWVVASKHPLLTPTRPCRWLLRCWKPFRLLSFSTGTLILNLS